MTRRRAARAVAVAAVLGALAGCSGSAGEGEGAEGLARPDQGVVAEAAAGTSAGSSSQVRRVSMEAACGRLSDKANGQPVEKVLELARGGRVTQQVIAAAAQGAGGLRAAAETAPVELAARLLLVADETDTRVTELRRGGSIDIDRTAFVAAGLEVVRACEQSRSSSGLARQTTQLASAASQTTIPGDGTFLVGPDVVAGTYRSEGSSSQDSRECVAYVSGEPGDISTFVRGSTSTGPAYLLLNAGEYVTTMFCRPFDIQG